MISITRQQLDLLIALQENERRAAQLQGELEKIPGRKAELESTLQENEREIEEMRSRLETLKKDYRAQENEFALNQSRINKRKSQLNSVKTNREYQSLLKEIDEISASNSNLEDASLKCLEEIEEAEKELAEKKKAWQEKSKEIEREKNSLDESAAEMRKQADRLETECRDIAEKLDPTLVKHYRQVRNRGGGLGLVPVENAVCRGCYLNIPPQMYNELQRGSELKFCPHCHRLIYVL